MFSCCTEIKGKREKKDRFFWFGKKKIKGIAFGIKKKKKGIIIVVVVLLFLLQKQSAKSET